ncbi:hypothetical protein KXW81_005044 [Aspergillus fumigatus]|nr:hypothetical protein KXW81_005044 [Aspergillus fumigatus]
MEDPKSVQKKNQMFGELRKVTKDMQKALEPVISCLANMMSSQTTSKRTHDLKRLIRQTTIQKNVEAVKSMTFETLMGYLEEYAGEMGVMLLNIETTHYHQLLGNLKNSAIDASQCCALDSRILYLEGFDAGIIMEQSQAKHNGPLKSTLGPCQPILALPCLSQLSETGSMYLNHLAGGGERCVHDDLTAANVYTSCSAAFAELKKQVCEACKRSDWPRMKEACQEIMTKHIEIATLWRVKPELLKIQNMKLYKALLAADFDSLDQNTQAKNLQLTRYVFSDAETKCVLWQVGKKGQFGDSIEPLDEVFLHEIMTGEKSELAPPATVNEFSGEEKKAMIEMEDEFAKFESSLRAEIIETMRKDLSAEEVCDIINVPVSTMRVFVRALNPEFIWEDLAVNFKGIILELVKDRSNRAESWPVRRLLWIKVGKNLQIEG